MLFSKILTAAGVFATVALAAPSAIREDAGEHVINRSADSQRKLESMKRWNDQIRATSKQVASKYVSSRLPFAVKAQQLGLRRSTVFTRARRAWR